MVTYGMTTDGDTWWVTYGVTHAPSAGRHVGVAAFIVNNNPETMKLRRAAISHSRRLVLRRTKRSSSRPTLAKARGEPGPITTGGGPWAPPPGPPAPERAPDTPS